MRRTISRKFLGVVCGVAFFMAAFFGVHLTMNMNVNSHGAMQDCPFIGSMNDVCIMTITEHIAKWQQLFTATVPSGKFLFAGLLFMILAFAAFSFRLSLFRLLNFQTQKSRAGPPDYSSGFLLRAFGQGILRKRE